MYGDETLIHVFDVDFNMLQGDSRLEKEYGPFNHVFHLGDGIFTHVVKDQGFDPTTVVWTHDSLAWRGQQENPQTFSDAVIYRDHLDDLGALAKFRRESPSGTEKRFVNGHGIRFLDLTAYDDGRTSHDDTASMGRCVTDSD